MVRNIYPIVLILLLCLAACQTQLSPVIEPTEMEIIQIQVSPASAHWMDAVAQCSDQTPNLGIYRQILPIDELDLSSADLILRLGVRQESDPFVTLLGTEEIVLVAGQDVPVDGLSLETVQAIFTDEYSQWNQVPEAQTVMDESQPIRTLSYPSGHELRRLFETSFLNSASIASNPIVFSTITTLKNLLIEHPFAISYALKSQAPEDVCTLRITSDTPQPGLQYVLAITSQEPTGPLRELLLCLQNTP